MNIVRFLTAAAALLTGTVQAQFDGLPFGPGSAQQAPTFSVSAKAAVSSYKEGQPFYIALKGDIPQPWHAYFRNPATVGDPMTAGLTAPEGFKVEGPYWQAPDRHEGMLGVAYTYNTPTVVWKVTPEAGAPQQAEFTASATAQTCSDTGCNAPETKTATISLSAGDGAAAADWEAEETKVEVLGDTASEVTATQTTDSVVLNFTAEGEVKSAYFFSDDNAINPTATQTLTKTDSGYSLTLPRNDNKDSMFPVKNEALVGKELPVLSGILTFDSKHTVVNVTFAGVAPAPAPAEEPEATEEADEEEPADDEEEATDEEEDTEEEETADEEEEGGDEDESADTTPAPAPTASPFGGGLFGDVMGGGQKATLSVTAKASVNTYKNGSAFYVALKGDIPQPWHAYFRNPATVGDPMTATLTAPEGFKVEGPYWQAPDRHEGMLGVAYSYNTPTVVWKVTPEAAAPQQAEFTASATAQTCCDEGCNPPDTKTATIILTAGDGAANAAWEAEESRVEVLGDTPTTLSMTQTAENVVLNFTAEGEVKSAYFFSDDNSINPTAAQTLTKTESGYSLTLPRNDNKDSMFPVKDETLVGKELPALSGILTFDGKHAKVNVSATAATPAPTETPAPATEAGGIPAGIWGIFGPLFLGGLILNLMPCVFPVIGLKIMSFVELGGGERRKVFMHSLVFVIGILVSFWLLATALIVVSNIEVLANTPWTQWLQTLWNDAGSDTRSWAVWMQNEWIVYCIMLLLLVLGLSMFGLFEIGVGATGAGQGLQQKKGLMGSFFQGLLVTVVATPCSAPFLGAAMPAAMSLPGVWMILALTFMALGLAFPYIVMGAFPSLVNILPRPGAWMESLKQGLSFLLFAAAAWMLDVYLAFLPEEYSVDRPWLLMSLVVFCTAFWVYGRWCPIYKNVSTRWTGGLIAVLLIALGVWGSMPRPVSEAPATTQPAVTESAAGYTVATGEHPTWNTWSKALMDKALADGHPVYVDFTAKWCATCQMNKKTAYTADVCALFEQGKVVLMRADKTRPDAAIDAEMRRLNRSSVPVNVLYLPGKEPAITTELLTPIYMDGFLTEKLGLKK
ncbi:MAG: protein-disulfide reductase DsbD family protein [Akkermansia sp.]|nr:protein-disulfide reductase DsbD family protein [Akkermansia sp.]